jgi:eukaryotic-like serine/threonine-protein kinase
VTETREAGVVATEVSGPAADATLPAAPGDEHRGASFGRFVVLGRLGTGGMGVVLSGYDPELDRKVALKLLHSTLGRGEAARARLQHEAKAMARLAHPNTVTVYEVGPAGDQLFIAMELVDGKTLRAWLDERERPWREVLSMFIAAGRGLEAAHAAGLVHRDFKPDNVLIGKDGRPRVSDFGHAASGTRVGDSGVEGGSVDASLSVHGVAVGTPSHMAPEQWLGGEVDARTDQFAFCVSLWRALWRRPPFAGDAWASLRDAVVEGRRAPPGESRGLPGWLAPVLDRGLAHEREKRWPSMGALLGELEQRANARRRAWIGAGAGGLVAIAGAALFVVETRPDPPEVCAAPRARIETVWSAARRTALGQHLAAIDPTLGPARFRSDRRASRRRRRCSIATCRRGRRCTSRPAAPTASSTRAPTPPTRRNRRASATGSRVRPRW